MGLSMNLLIGAYILIAMSEALRQLCCTVGTNIHQSLVIPAHRKENYGNVKLTLNSIKYTEVQRDTD